MSERMITDKELAERANLSRAAHDGLYAAASRRRCEGFNEYTKALADLHELLDRQEPALLARLENAERLLRRSPSMDKEQLAADVTAHFTAVEGKP